jgi:hypothetical protein
MAQVVDHLPSKHEALNSNPSTTKKENISEKQRKLFLLPLQYKDQYKDKQTSVL